MKILKFIAALATALALVPFLQSCLEDNDSNYPWLAMTTVKTLKNVEHGYYFGLHDNSTMYPGDTTAINNYTPIDGQRAFVYFDYLDQPMPGYDYNVKVEQIINILTKDIVELTQENAEDIGDDKIDATDLWITQNYLNIVFRYYGSGNIDKKHFLNLVENTLNAEKNKEGYINLEFRHNIKGDTSHQVDNGYVSFKLDKIAAQMKEAKGLTVRVNTLHDGVKFYQIDFEEKATKQVGQQFTTTVHTGQAIY